MKPSQRRPVFANVPGRPGLKRFVGFEGDPGTHGAKPQNLPRSVRNIVGGRMSGLGALGVADRHNLFPAGDGSPGNLFQGEYDERDVWGTSNPPATALVTTPPDPSVAVPAPELPGQIDTGLTVPFGVSIVKWRNPTTMQSVPIISSTPSNTPVLSLNMERNALLIQNNSFVTVSTDTPPNFYIGFNAQPQQGLSLALQPLSGILFDIITPRDAIYVLIAGGAGASQVVQGVVVQGTYAPL